MDGITGLAAVVMIFGMPTTILGMYTFYRVRKLRTEERLAAMQRGVSVPMEPDLTQAAHSRRAGIQSVAKSWMTKKLTARFRCRPLYPRKSRRAANAASARRRYALF